MYVVHHKDALAEGGNEFVHGGAGNAACGAFEAIEQSILVTLSLKFANEPRARIREGFVIHVHGVLSGEQKAEAEGACLFQHAQQRTF